MFYYADSRLDGKHVMIVMGDKASIEKGGIPTTAQQGGTMTVLAAGE